MPDLNNYCATGRLGRDPEIQDVNGNDVARFSLAIDDSYKRRDGEKVDRVCWLDCEAWGGTAGILQRYAGKGARVAVMGNLQMDQWQDKATGANRSKIKLRLANFGGLTLLGSPGESGRSGGGQREIQNDSPRQTRQPDASAPSQDIDPDDIPF